MASAVNKLIPADPDKVMVIRRVTPQILTCSQPFLRAGHFKIGGRGTVVKMANDELAVFSPIALTANVRSQMQEQLGSTNVKYLTALDQEHHIFLEQWHKEYPQARILMPETLPGLRDKQSYFKLPDENVKIFKKGDQEGWKVDSAFDSEFDVEYVDGHANKELVFRHKPSKTLIEADLMFNLPATEQYSKTGESATSGVLSKFFARLMSAKGEAIWQRRLIWYAISSQDRKSYAESVARIDKWDFDRIIPCHGDVIETGGKGIFEKIMTWHLELAKKGS